MSQLSEILEAVARNLLPDGHTYEKHDMVEAAREMRLDVIASHAVAAIVSSTADPIVVSLYRASRPVIDGMLTGLGSPTSEHKPSKVRRRPVKKQGKPRVELGTRSSTVKREILDAEFVDL